MVQEQIIMMGQIFFINFIVCWGGPYGGPHFLYIVSDISLALCPTLSPLDSHIIPLTTRHHQRPSRPAAVYMVYMGFRVMRGCEFLSFAFSFPFRVTVYSCKELCSAGNFCVFR
jgi:hypothetical protein